jgi:hypothetical protein
MKNLKCQGVGTSKRIKGRKLKRQNVIKFSIKKFFQCRNEEKLRFERRIQNLKDLELRKGSKARELRK